MGLSGCSIQSLHERVYSVYGACVGSMAGGRDIIQHQAHSICSLNTHLYDESSPTMHLAPVSHLIF